MKILFTGGGTAGHIFPILALIEKAKAKGIDYLYVGSNGMEAKIAHQNRLNFQSIPVGKWRHYWDWRNLTDVFKTLSGLVKAYFILKKYQPDVVFAKGGYVTFPVLYWVRKMRLPLIIHESDIVPGKANIWAAKFARKICVGFPIENYDQLPKEKLVYTGIPIKENDKAFIKPTQRPLLLITGGSLGSQRINKLINEIKLRLTEKYEVFHQIGENNLKDEEPISNYHAFAFRDDLSSIIKSADLIISRAGATTLAEIAYYAKPAIVIPYPFASHQHQEKNARFLSGKQAIELLDEEGLDSETLFNKIDYILSDNEARERLSSNIKNFSKLGSADQILELMEQDEKNTD